MKRKEHWETVFSTKQPHEVSWTQAIPTTSLDLIASCELSKDAEIIDIGGGDSNLVDHLLALGYKNISVLDISSHAFDRAKKRLGEKADLVTWIVSDIVDFKPTKKYDLWHDRAAFHFLTEKSQIQAYQNLINEHVKEYLIIGTFSENGPKKCSGLDICQYNSVSLNELFQLNFTPITTFKEDHVTPFETTQNFVFSSFKRK
jgi:SAM-dependent methyltransferase